VVAKTRDAARRAARLGKVEIAQQQPAISVDDAVAMQTEDILPPYQYGRGDVMAELQAAAHRIEESFLVGGQEHFYLEGQIAFAMPDEHGGMMVYTSTQHPSEVQHCIAKMLHVPE